MAEKLNSILLAYSLLSVSAGKGVHVDYCYHFSSLFQ